MSVYRAEDKVVVTYTLTIDTSETAGRYWDDGDAETLSEPEFAKRMLRHVDLRSLIENERVDVSIAFAKESEVG